MDTCNGDFKFWLVVESTMRLKFDPPDPDFSAQDSWQEKILLNFVVNHYSYIFYYSTWLHLKDCVLGAKSAILVLIIVLFKKVFMVKTGNLTPLNVSSS